MRTASKTWEGVREHGVILVTVPSSQWTRSVHEWDIRRMRIYLREARQVPAQTRLEIAAWLEHQEAYMENEMGAGCELPPVLAERLAWFSFGAAVVGLIVLIVTVTEVIL
jgi:hypothetical protein